MEIDIHEFAICVMQKFGKDIPATEMEMVSFQIDLALKSFFSNKKYIWPLVWSNIQFCVLLHEK
nr:unnamed protein product [Callosobruchus chinensis]